MLITPNRKQILRNKITRKAQIKPQWWHGYFRTRIDCKESRHARQKAKCGLP